MANVALGKRILEEAVRHPEIATNGTVSGYTGKEGFADFYWPGTLTVDLGSVHEIQTVRVLIWDGLGSGRGQRANRTYRYRLLTSEDESTWTVHYDTGSEGTLGWQVHNFDPAARMRYVRIHGLWNSAHERIHIVEIEAHDSPAPSLSREPTRVHTSKASSPIIEIGSGTPTAMQLTRTITEIEQLASAHSFINPDFMDGIVRRLQTSVRDVAQLEASVEAIRRQILEPVQAELEKSAKIGKFSVWGFWVGIVGGILAIIALTLQLLGIG